VETLGGEFEALIKAYQNGLDVEGETERIVEGFTAARIDAVSKRWWLKGAFNSRKTFLQAGINAFLSGSSEGYIHCISTLLPQVEGIIRLDYLKETGKGKDVKVRELLTNLAEKRRAKSGSDASLLLPSSFLRYLDDVVYASFDLESGKLDLSRHSSTHGVARAEDYTRMRALQVILVLDQIFFYI